MATIAAKSKVAASAESSTSDILYARLAGFQVDIARLREHFERRVKNTPATPYRDHRVDYLGWAVTSRDGSTEDGVRRIALSSSTNRKRGTLATDICKGYLAEVMESLQAYGVSPYRARIMLLESEGTEMPFHTDARSETWRLHIPIVTNPEAYFEWRCDDGEVERVHMPADGSAWLVRVDVEHRAVNRGGAGGRTHLLMGLNRAPLLEMLGEPQRLTPGETLLKQPVGL